MKSTEGPLSHVALCVLSYDGSSALWEPCIRSLREAWPDCPLQLYLLTNFRKYEGDPGVITLDIGTDVDWSTNVLKALPRIPQKYVLFTFDDFILRAVDSAAVRRYLETAVRSNWPYLTLYPNNYRREEVAPGVRRIAEAGIYRCTLVYGLIQKDLLMRLLCPGESAWQFEIESGRRARDVPLYSVDKPVFRHHHLLRKGVWMRPAYEIVSRRYKLDAGRPVESHFACILRESKEWLFRKYHRWAPPSWVEAMDSRRK
jgi:hypothetical protein